MHRAGEDRNSSSRRGLSRAAVLPSLARLGRRHVPFSTRNRAGRGFDSHQAAPGWLAELSTHDRRLDGHRLGLPSPLSCSLSTLSAHSRGGAFTHAARISRAGIMRVRGGSRRTLTTMRHWWERVPWPGCAGSRSGYPVVSRARHAWSRAGTALTGWCRSASRPRRFEHGAVADPVGVVDQRERVVGVEVAGEDLGGEPDPAGQAGLVQDVHDGAGGVGDPHWHLLTPLGA